MESSRAISVVYLLVALFLIILNDKAVWFTLSGILLIFEWQIVCAALFGIKEIEKRLTVWENVRIASHLLYFVVLTGSFFAIKSWFPNAHTFGLIVLAIIFLFLKEISFKICKYNAITSKKDS